MKYNLCWALFTVDALCFVQMRLSLIWRPVALSLLNHSPSWWLEAAEGGIFLTSFLSRLRTRSLSSTIDNDFEDKVPVWWRILPFNQADDGRVGSVLDGVIFLVGGTVIFVEWKQLRGWDSCPVDFLCSLWAQQRYSSDSFVVSSSCLIVLKAELKSRNRTHS